MDANVGLGDRIVLLGEDGRKHALTVEPGARRVEGLGVVDPASLAGAAFGAAVPVGNRRFLVLRPSLLDRIETLDRKAQIILPRTPRTSSSSATSPPEGRSSRAGPARGR